MALVNRFRRGHNFVIDITGRSRAVWGAGLVGQYPDAVDRGVIYWESPERAWVNTMWGSLSPCGTRHHHHAAQMRRGLSKRRRLSLSSTFISPSENGCPSLHTPASSQSNLHVSLPLGSTSTVMVAVAISSSSTGPSTVNCSEWIKNARYSLPLACW